MKIENGKWKIVEGWELVELLFNAERGERREEDGEDTEMGNKGWPEELDALKAAAAYHTLLMENEEVRVLETRIPVGHTVPVHTHRWPGVYYIMSWSHFVRRDGEGNVLLDTRGGVGTAPGSAVWTEPLGPHSVENVGEKDIRIIAVELKGSPRASLDGTRVFGRLA